MKGKFSTHKKQNYGMITKMRFSHLLRFFILTVVSCILLPEIRRI